MSNPSLVNPSGASLDDVLKMFFGADFSGANTGVFQASLYMEAMTPTSYNGADTP
jgi:hypothetical protein